MNPAIAYNRISPNGILKTIEGDTIQNRECVKSFLLYGPTCWREPNVGSMSNKVLLPIWTALPYTRL